METQSENFIHRLMNLKGKFGYSKVTLQYIRMMDWLLGEFYYVKSSNPLAEVWRKFCILANMIFLAMPLTYMAFTPSPGINNYLFSMCILILVIYYGIVIPIASILHGQRVIEALRILDENFISFPNANSKYPSTVVLFCRSKFPMEHVYILVILLGMSVAGYISCTIMYFMIGDAQEAKLQDPAAYLFPIYCENIKSIRGFCFVMFIQLLMALPSTTVHISEPFYFMFLAKELYERFQVVCQSIENYSRVFLCRYEELCESSEIRLMEKLQDDFLRDIRVYVEYHEKLIRVIFHLKPYFKLIMSICLVMLMYMEVNTFYIFLNVEGSTLMFKLKILNYAVTFYILLLSGCLTGRLLSDMEDMFKNAVYDVPWYYFSAKNRKTIYLLLIRAHMRLEYKSMKIFVINMTLFQRFSVQIYNVVNVLKKATIKKKNQTAF